MEMSRFAQRRQGSAPMIGPAQQAAARAPPRDAHDAKCANCNQTGHTAQQCGRPKLAMDQRKCHVCDKSGHLARNCPDNKRKANIVHTDQIDEKPARLGVLTLGDLPIQRARLSQRQRRTARADPGTTLSNAFASLAEEDEHEDVPGHTVGVFRGNHSQSLSGQEEAFPPLPPPPTASNEWRRPSAEMPRTC